MSKPDKYTYDVIIIGAGISGLVCGCYLAKAGMKVLIAEKHSKPGGYCTSFKRNGFIFDAAAHSFGGYRYGNLGKIFETLGIDRKITIRKYDPSDVIITPDHKVAFWSDLDKTIDSISAAFPQERKNIHRLINFMLDPEPAGFVRLRNWTFKDLLDQYISDDKLKTVLSFPLFGNSGLPPSILSAFIGVKIFTESLLDGGYFPENGMQALPDALVEKFEELGGEVQLSCSVKKIRIRNNAVAGVITDNGGLISSPCVVSSGDARKTFITLVGKRAGTNALFSKIRGMEPSLSMFIIYIGVKEFLPEWPRHRTNVWFLSHFDLDGAYASAKSGKFNSIRQYIAHFIPEKNIIVGFLNAPFKNIRYWDNARHALQESFIEKIEADIAPSLSSRTIYKGSATPHTLFQYTSNFKGAAYGWECVPSQFADYNLRNPPFIQGLHLTGHWTTQGHGIPGVAYLGWATANHLIKRMVKK